jgi:hypothetical protein
MGKPERQILDGGKRQIRVAASRRAGPDNQRQINPKEKLIALEHRTQHEKLAHVGNAASLLSGQKRLFVFTSDSQNERAHRTEFA